MKKKKQTIHSSPDCGYPSLTATWCGRCWKKHFKTTMTNNNNKEAKKIFKIIRKARNQAKLEVLGEIEIKKEPSLNKDDKWVKGFNHAILHLSHKITQLKNKYDK